MKDWTKIYMYIACFVLFAGFAYFVLSIKQLNNEVVSCALDIIQCPNGKYVARIAPRCEFDCGAPITNQKVGSLSGRVTISPVCPVERIPPDPNCAPRGYQTGIQIISDDHFVEQINSDQNGYFYVLLKSGTYDLRPIAANVLPRCNDASGVIIQDNATTTVMIDCDSGIR